MIYVEKLHLPKNPIDAEYRRQKTKVADKWCKHPRHLLTPIDLYGAGYGEEIIHTKGCKCGHILDDIELNKLK